MNGDNQPVGHRNEGMTPKQKYDERKRLRIENDLREEQKRKDRMDRSDDMEASFERMLRAMERMADVMELWADQQGQSVSGASS